MKKTLLVATILLAAGNISVLAQKTVVKFENTQTRVVGADANAYVKPLTVELQIVNNERIEDEWTFTQAEIESLNGEVNNIRSAAVYRSAAKYKVDAIVAATFRIHNNPKNDGSFLVEVKGYPANFVNWKTATPADYEWIRMEKVKTTADVQRNMEAVVKQ